MRVWSTHTRGYFVSFVEQSGREKREKINLQRSSSSHDENTQGEMIIIKFNAVYRRKNV